MSPLPPCDALSGDLACTVARGEGDQAALGGVQCGWRHFHQDSRRTVIKLTIVEHLPFHGINVPFVGNALKRLIAAISEV